MLSAIKSLMTFGHQIGYLQWNVGASLRIPSVKNTIGERILPENDVHRMINVEPNSRNKVMLRLLYAAGLRVSEVVTLRWRDLAARGDSGQITVYGKGGRTRFVLLSAATWKELQAMKVDPEPDEPVFRSRKGGGALSHVNDAYRPAMRVVVSRRASSEKAAARSATVGLRDRC